MNDDLMGLLDEFVEAARALVEIQESLFDRFETFVGISAYDFWVKQQMPNRLNDDLRDDFWQFNFHGLELDVDSRTDKRFARLELGPGGMTNVFSGWAIGVFVVCASKPWPIFPKLRSRFKRSGRVPFFQPCAELERLARQAGHFSYANQELLDLKQRFTRRCDDGSSVIDIPDTMSTGHPLDVFLCDRLVLK